MSTIRNYAIAIGIEIIRFVAGLFLFLFWLPWHWWRTRSSREGE